MPSATLTTTIAGLDIDRLSDSWKVLADEFAGTPAVLEVALQGVARFSRDGGRSVTTNCAGSSPMPIKVTSVLADRSAAIVRMLTDSVPCSPS